MKILIIEDNPGDRVLLKEAFMRMTAPNDLVFAQDAEEAMVILQRARSSRDAMQPQLIILDLNLPKRSGKEFLRELKSDKDLRKIPVLILTSSRSESDIVQCYNAGASCYLEKPMSFDALEKMVEAICKFWLKEVTYAKNS